MAYQPHTLVTFGGTLGEVGDDDEIWQVGIRGFQTGGGPVAPTELAALALSILRGDTGSGGGLEGLWHNDTGTIPSQAKLVWCKAANIAPDGSYSAAPGIAEMAPVAGGGVQKLPSFCSIVTTWTTGKSFGKALRGRIYLPNYGASLGSGSIITPAARDAVGAFAQDLLHAVDHSDDGSHGGVYDFNPYVVSESGVSNPITGIRVGNVVDYISRRKNAVPESYKNFALEGPSGG